MTRTVLYYVAAAAFMIAAIATGLGSQWIFMGAFIALAAAFLVIAIRSGRTNSPPSGNADSPAREGR